ncbi:Tryptophan--tRNA ligase [Alteripontixanthobacter maritimus]|uniref:Tryptophan--tRNA ligase n=1 Tax=Alteripontixanthobacter maritimus TaxID=2161824 RepID=A0A369Q8W5_9SPHN|nr:tryptophan--tRNA ligase [Alteripontixanthobacter maritimus]RDC60790.1 Tryptophan--tRNA ligase [Alteripontixanthobacter maritimus]
MRADTQTETPLKTAPQTSRRIVSGIQPTGNLHLGNYLGAIRNWVRMQDEMAEANRIEAVEGGSAAQNQCLFFLADLHALSLPHDPAELRRGTLEMAAALVACGIDPARSILFNQAQVPAHAELQWLLSGTARMGWLNRMTQFKDKAGKHREGASIALFTYPVLQAADVLLYQATHVPVGEDQKQHLELARDIAQKFNNDFGGASDDDGKGGTIFTFPEPIIPPQAARIMSLRDGTAKMSKSDPSEMSRINLNDDADMIMKKVKKAKTDAEPLPSELDGLDGRAEALNLVTIYAAMTNTMPADVLAEFAGRGFGQFKPALGEVLVETLAPITGRFAALLKDREELDAILARGAAHARELARPTLSSAYEALGLVRVVTD